MAKRFSFGAISLVLLVFVGCGSTQFSPNAGAPNGATPLSTATVPITSTKTTGGTPIPTGGTMTPGAVTLTLNASSYTSGQPIIVTIHNGLNTTIMTADHKTSCLMVTLQRQTANAWVDLAPCKSLMPTRLIELAAQSATPVALSNGPQTATASWSAGTYRITFIYGTSTQSAAAGAGTSYSATFTIT